jgi:bifunctional non-homologous end joining protein LigD
MKKVGKERSCRHTKDVAKKGGVEEVALKPPEVEKANLPVMRPNDGDWEFSVGDDKVVEMKYDGTYAFVIRDQDGVKMPGRSFKSDYVANHPEFVRDGMLLPKDTILCGELAFFDEEGNDHFLTALAKEETWLELGYTPKYIVFDILKSNGRTLLGSDWKTRRAVLIELFDHTEFESFELIKSYSTPNGKTFAWTQSREGVVIKDINSMIKDGRTNEWRKVKKLKAEDFWAIGFTKGTGAREATFGAMMLANKELTEDGCYEYITKTSGFTNAQLEYFLEKAVRNDELPIQGGVPKSKLLYLFDPILVEIKYQRKTRTGSLIMPRFVKERTDITG